MTVAKRHVFMQKKVYLRLQRQDVAGEIVVPEWCVPHLQTRQLLW